jgi:hypothetical protein
MSLCSSIPFFKLDKVAWGSGYLEIVDGKPSVIPSLPSAVDSITGEFARTGATYRYDPVAKTINVRATIPKGYLPLGVRSEFTTLYVLDDESGVVAIAVGMPVWMSSDRGLTVEFVIDTARPTI